MQAGEEVFEKSILSGVIRTYRDFSNYLSVTFGAKFFQFMRKYSPFYQSQLTAGAEFGSATKALFIFMASVVSSNFIQFAVWVPTWIGQVLFVDTGLNPISEFLLAVFATKDASEDSLGEEATSDASSITFNLTEPAGFLFFPGYKPQTHISGDNYYPTGMWYVLCGFITLLSTLFVYTARVSQQIRNPSLAVSSSSPLPPGTSSILNALFGGWDYTHYSTDATSKVRREIVTVIKEGEADADRASQKTTVVVTKRSARSCSPSGSCSCSSASSSPPPAPPSSPLCSRPLRYATRSSSCCARMCLWWARSRTLSLSPSSTRWCPRSSAPL